MRVFLVILSLAIFNVASFAQTPRLPDYAALLTILDTIPAGLKLKTNGKISPVTAVAATDAMTAATKDKVAKLAIRVDKVEATTNHGQRLRVESDDVKVNFRGDSISCVVVAYFAADQGSALTNIRKGQMISVDGLIIKTEVGEKVHIELKNCQVLGK